jgi:hypothetical protein
MWPSALARSVLVAAAIITARQSLGDHYRIVIAHGIDLCIPMAANLRCGDTERSLESTIPSSS